MGVDFTGSHADMDVKQHEATYKMFIALTKWSVIGLVIFLGLMAYFVA